MQKIKIFTDMCADLPRKYIEENDIEILPIYYHFEDGEIYGDEKNLTIEEFYKKAEKQKPMTMGCNPDKIYISFKKFLDEGYDILCIMFSSALSVGYQSALIAKSILVENYNEDRVNIINSKRGSLSQGYMVKEAINRLKKGENIKEIKEYLLTHIDNFKCLFSVKTLDFLARSGRISHIKGIIGNVLNLKPIFGFDNEGKLYSQGNKRGLKKVISEITNDIKVFKPKEITIAHANDISLAKEIAEYIKEKTGIICDIVDLNFCTSSNTGQGSFGISYYK